MTNHRELEKSKVYITSQIVDYIPNSVVSKNILEKLTGNISILSFDDKEGLSEKISPSDTVAQIIIDRASYFMEEGECIIIPAHKSHSIKGNKRFKMIVTIIKSGYE
ncbi:cupin [Chryseobacterium sp.]|uniref:cupin n=1 Tax=Chryseobacterium sp. TaxID=1871047 RepID=UPI0032195E08